MGTRGLRVVCYNGRYYLTWNEYDSYFAGLGALVVAGIPADSKQYQTWLAKMRAHFAAEERRLEEHVYEIREGRGPNMHFYHYARVPSEMPRLSSYVGAEYVYTTDLDAEVLTINDTVHWKLNNIPRQDDLWYKSIRRSIYVDVMTVAQDDDDGGGGSLEAHMGSLALALPAKDQAVSGAIDARLCTPRRRLDDDNGGGSEPHKTFLAVMAAQVWAAHADDITSFGRKWRPGAFPFRELAFALVSVAADAASYHSFSGGRCGLRLCMKLGPRHVHRPRNQFWLDADWVGDKAPLPEFGTLFHRPGARPGAAPAETTYWVMDDVLVSLALVVDNAAVVAAMEWGLQQEGRRRQRPFQIVVLSLYEVAFGEVSWPSGSGEEEQPAPTPTLHLTEALALSPMRENLCFSNHPRERPVRVPQDAEPLPSPHKYVVDNAHLLTPPLLVENFPGIAALVNFFDAAARRRAASSSPGRLPPELYDHILRYADYDTWKACLAVSPGIRALCLSRYRLDDQTALISGPFVLAHQQTKQPMLAFGFEERDTGLKRLGMRFQDRQGTRKFNWMPVIGSGDRKVLIVDAKVHFEEGPV